MSDENKGMTVTLSGYQESEVFDFLSQRVRDTFDSMLREKVNELAANAVEEALTASAVEAIDAQVKAAIEEGLQPHDRYGEPEGPRKTIKAFVLDHLKQTVEGRYGYGRQTRIEKLASELLEEALKKDLGAELKKAREAFSAQINATLQAKLAETLKSALGLR